MDVPPMPEPLRALVEEVARETLAPLGSALRLALPVPAALDPWPAKLGYRRPAEPGQTVSGKRAAVWAALPEGGALTAPALAKAAGVGVGVLHTMAKAGLLLPVELVEIEVPPAPDPEAPGVELTPDQRQGAARLVQAVAEAKFTATLLEGVPGAGKTEVYFEAVAEALRRGRRVLVLLPEIALSAQWLARFERRFGTAPAVWHSALTSAQRRRTWRLIAEGRVPAVVGARSALFLPLTDLGVVVIDEEHDASFKQGDGVTYNARDMALARARLEGCPAILATATPSVETATAAGAVAGGPRAEPGWGHVLLPARHGGAVMPAVKPDRPAPRPAAPRRLRGPAVARPPWPRPWPWADSRSSSSTGAATPRSPCAAPAATGSPAPTARPGWWRIACAAGSSATIAASACRCRSTARPAAASGRWWPRVPGSSGWPRSWRRSSPTHGWR